MKKKRVLILNLTRMGDLLQTTPLIYSFRQKYPEYEITLAVNIKFASILNHFHEFDRQINLDLKQFNEEGKKFNIVTLFHYFDEFIDTLNQQEYDITVNITHSRFSAVLTSLIKTKEVYGFTISEEGDRVIKGNWMKYFSSVLFHRKFNRFNIVDIY